MRCARADIVKASSGPRYVVGCRTKVDPTKLVAGTRVALDMTTLTIMRVLPREVRPSSSRPIARCTVCCCCCCCYCRGLEYVATQRPGAIAPALWSSSSRLLARGAASVARDRRFGAGAAHATLTYRLAGRSTRRCMQWA